MIGVGVELLVAVLFVAFMVTQVVMPVWRETQTFPMFRRESRIRRDRTEAAQELRERTLQEEVEHLRAQVREQAKVDEGRERVRAYRRLDRDEAEQRSVAGEE